MHPLKILAFIIGALPILVFLLTLILTDGAPFHPLSPREESGPAAAAPALPQAKQERYGSVAAVGHNGADEPIAETWNAEAAVSPDQGEERERMVNFERDAEILYMLFGGAHPDLRPSP